MISTQPELGQSRTKSLEFRLGLRRQDAAAAPRALRQDAVARCGGAHVRMTAGAVHQVARDRVVEAGSLPLPNLISSLTPQSSRPHHRRSMATQAVTGQGDVQEAGRRDLREPLRSAREVWVRLNGMPPNCLSKATGHGHQAAAAPLDRSPTSWLKMLSRFNLPADMAIRMRPHEMCGVVGRQPVDPLHRKVPCVLPWC